MSPFPERSPFYHISPSRPYTQPSRPRTVDFLPSVPSQTAWYLRPSFPWQRQTGDRCLRLYMPAVQRRQRQQFYLGCVLFKLTQGERLDRTPNANPCVVCLSLKITSSLCYHVNTSYQGFRANKDAYGQNWQNALPHRSIAIERFNCRSIVVFLM